MAATVIRGEIVSRVNLANVFTVRQRDVGAFVGSVGPKKMSDVCQALAIALGCD